MSTSTITKQTETYSVSTPATQPQTRRFFPVEPLSKIYVYSAFATQAHAEQAMQTLYAAGCRKEFVYQASPQEYLQALEEREQQHAPSKGRLLSFLSSTEIGHFREAYQQEALRGSHILAVQLRAAEEGEPVHALLRQTHAHCITYVSPWAVAHVTAARANAWQ